MNTCQSSIRRFVFVVYASLIAGAATPQHINAQGTYTPVTEADVLAIKLIHYFSADRKHHTGDFEWSFTKTEFVVRKGKGAIPADLLDKLLVNKAGADEIQGKWKLAEAAGGKGKELVFTAIKAGAQNGRKEARLPIYRTAPTVIRIGEPQYVFARGSDAAATGAESENLTTRVEVRSWFVVPGLSLAESKRPIHWVGLVVDADPKGEGKGTLTLNPNPPAFDEFGDLLNGWETKPVDIKRESFPLVELECIVAYVKSGQVERVNQGAVTRQIYRVTGPKIKSPLFFTTTGPGLTTGRLLVHDAKGRVESVVELKDTRPPEPEVLQIPCHPGCFPAGTLVLIGDRIVTIEKLRVGDAVTSIDADGRAANRKIEHVFTTKNRLVELRTDGGRLLTTRTQPVALVRGGFHTVEELKAGDKVWQWRDGARQAAVVQSVAPTDREEQVYNLVIGDSAIFVAGDFLVRGKPPAENVAPAGVARHDHHE
ncbi:MAG: hypothetical protein HY290_02675 [Planctomycetia bacterium]|nr:hypothetical protein [Planctomycetia bacterium]